MNSMLATESTTDTHSRAADKPASTHPLLETWGRNEPMRHIPEIGWIAAKLDRDVRRGFEIVWQPYAALAADDPRRAAIETELKAFCRAVDRLADTARHGRNGHNPSELGDRIRHAIDHAVACINTIDPALFGRRFPVQTHERSKAEPVHSSLVVVINHLQKTIELVRTIDRGLDEKLLEGLVVLSNPVDARMLQPIA